MLPSDLILLIERVPYGGRVIVWLPLCITLGAMLATIIPAPASDSSVYYRALYRVLQWCALNIGAAKNASDPVSRAEILTGQVAGATLTTTGPGLRPTVAANEADRAAVVAAIVDDKTTITSIKVSPDPNVTLPETTQK